MTKALEVEGMSVRYHIWNHQIADRDTPYCRKQNYKEDMFQEEEPEVLHGVSFSVEKGEIVGIVGESGSGKSTAMLAVAGLLDGRASVRYETVLAGGKTPVPGKNIALIFQDSLSCLNPSVRIGRQIMETIRIRKKCGRKEAYRRAEELLDQVGIRNPKLRMKQYPFELSGGMRQRAVIAIALACEPEVIIADEPTTSLDAAVQAQILLLLKRIVRETGTALLLVSHDMGVTAAMCSRIYVMHRGRVVESGTAEDIFYAPQEEYTRQLLSNSGKTGKEKRSRRSIGDTGTGETLVRAAHVTKAFDSRDGVRDLSVELKQGEVLALVGESGSGKTTLARILSGILKPDNGILYYQGTPIDDIQRRTACEGRIQMVFQDPYASLNPSLTVRQALREAFLPYLKRKYGIRRPDEQEIEVRIREILELTGLKKEDENRYPSAFSGGQRQRIGIARALIAKPELLICDEALSSLDAATREQILELLFKIQRESGIACLFISHDLHVVRRISGRIAVMYGGRIVETGSTQEVCSDPWHPYTKMLIEAVPEPDPIRAAKIKAAPAADCGRQGLDKCEKGRCQTGREKEKKEGCPFARQCGYAMECCVKELPGEYAFGSRKVSCFLYSEEHTGRRGEGYRMISQI